MKRRADIQSLSIRLDVEKFSKADWVDLYFDLFRQVFGEQSPEEEIFQDAKKRRGMLRLNRIARR